MASSKRKKSRFSWTKVLFGLFILGIVGAIIGVVGYLMIILRGQTLYATYKDKMVMSEASIVYDIEGKAVNTLYRENREMVEYKELPKMLVNAFIATEDKRFDQHNGVDLLSIARALVKDIIQLSAVEGGSTITQQLAKNMFLSSEKTAFRKATEMSIALSLENNMSKDEIITMYLNRIYFGKRAYGIKAASKTYFGISDLSQLKVWQIATLAAMPKAPSTYNPLDNPTKSKERRAVVLRLMTDQGYITEQERAEAIDIEYIPPVGGKSEFATFTDYVIKEAVDWYKIDEEKLFRGGYAIYTTMNSNAQKIVEQTYDNPKFFQQDAADGVKAQSAMVIVDHRNGGIVAMIGGRGYNSKDLNRAIIPARQPGSSFKPLIVYAPAIESGKWNPNSMLEDKEQAYNGYTPRNWDNQYRDEVSMFDAMKQSMNQPAVWLLNQIGVKTGIDFVSKLGFTMDKQKDNNLSIALGAVTNGTSPLQMAQAYGAFANNGVMHTSHAIIKINDSNGKEVAKYKPDKGIKVMNPKTAYYMTKLMQAVLEPGALGANANLGNRPAAGKTGTTQLDLKGYEKYNRDVWFAGYTPEWSAAIWQGFDKTDAKHFITVGSGTMATIFREVFSKSLAKTPITFFKKPDGVQELGDTLPDVSDLKAVYQVNVKRVKLNWTPISIESATYQVFRKGPKDKEFVNLFEVKNPDDVHDITVTLGETYQYYVIAYNPDTNSISDKSNVVEIKITTESPSLSPKPSGSLSPSTSNNLKTTPGVSIKPSGSTTPTSTPSPTPNGTLQPTNGQNGVQGSSAKPTVSSNSTTP